MFVCSYNCKIVRLYPLVTEMLVNVLNIKEDVEMEEDGGEISSLNNLC